MAQKRSKAPKQGILDEEYQFKPVVPDLRKTFGEDIRYKFFKYREMEIPDASLPPGITNLEYVIAQGDNDLSEGIPFASSAPPEQRALLLMRSFAADLFGLDGNAGAGSPTIQVFQKHIMQSRLGTHCIFSLRRRGIEIEEHSFAVHLDQNKRVVMVCCTYLPNLPGSFGEKSDFPNDPVRKSLIGIDYESAKAEKQWLVLWQGEGENKTSSIVPGSQVKLRRPVDLNAAKKANLLGITADGIKKQYHNSSGAYSMGLGKIIRNFFIETDEPQGIDALGDGRIESNKYQAVLRNLESNSELVGRFVAVQDEIDTSTENRRGIFTRESLSSFDRVNAYYYLDYVQRYFRETLDFQVLGEYPHLNPVRVVLKAEDSELMAEYDVISERIIFYQIESTETTAARDPRFIFHEFLHTVTDAIARLPRGGTASTTARSQETLQAQAMDEGLADYFACSLARQLGSQRAAFYFVTNGQWKLERDLQAEPPASFTIDQFKDVRDSTWRRSKYQLGEQWARRLWSLREQVGPEVADMLIGHSIFFLTRWATFRHGIQALHLADRLLFSGEHKEELNEFEHQMNLFLNDAPVEQIYAQ